MKTKILIYGGTNIYGDIEIFLVSLVKHLLLSDEVIVMSGGFDHYIKYPGRKSVDRIVLETARKQIKPEIFNNRFETWLPLTDDREKKVVRFREGTVKTVIGSTQARRFNIVKEADAIITIKGEGHTRSIIELALAIDKPVLPIAFTGGDSGKMWKIYEDDILSLLPVPGSLMVDLKEQHTGKKKLIAMGKAVAGFIKSAIPKKCLVLMPFSAVHNNFYDNALKPAIEKANCIPHRIDRNDAAGHIPALFQTSLENSHAVIVDITGLNPNVLYELGYLYALKKVPLIISRNETSGTIKPADIPFYLKQEMIINQTESKPGYEKIADQVTKYLLESIH